MKDIIAKFFIEENNADPLNLFHLIDNYPSLLLNFLENLDKYMIKKEEFFKIEETQNIKLFRFLIERKLLGNEFKLTEYIKNNFDLISSLQNDIEEGNIYYSDIFPFYLNNKNDELKKKLLIISLNDEELSSKLEKKIDDYIKEINKISKDLNLVYNDLRKYLFDTEKDNINILNESIDKIKNGYLNCYEKNYKAQCQQLINTYKEKAQLRYLMKNSLFFNTIYENEKEITKRDIDCINQAEVKFDELKKIFSKLALNSLRKDILNICINSIKGKKENEISKEVDLLIEIFKKDLKSSEYNKNNIVHSLIVLSKRKDIYYSSIAMSVFIDNIGAKKTKFYSILKDIISNLKDCYSEEIISNAINCLKKYEIDIDILYNENYKNNNYIKILMKLKEHPEKFLLERNIYECYELKELVREMDNTFLSLNDILDLEKCIELMNKIRTIQTFKEMNDSDIIKSFIKKIVNYKNIETNFTQYINNYQEIKNLFFYGLHIF